MLELRSSMTPRKANSRKEIVQRQQKSRSSSPETIAPRRTTRRRRSAAVCEDQDCAPDEEPGTPTGELSSPQQPLPSPCSDPIVCPDFDHGELPDYESSAREDSLPPLESVSTEGLEDRTKPFPVAGVTFPRITAGTFSNLKLDPVYYQNSMAFRSILENGLEDTFWSVRAIHWLLIVPLAAFLIDLNLQQIPRWQGYNAGKRMALFAVMDSEQFAAAWLIYPILLSHLLSVVSGLWTAHRRLHVRMVHNGHDTPLEQASLLASLLLVYVQDLINFVVEPLMMVFLTLALREFVPALFQQNSPVGRTLVVAGFLQTVRWVIESLDVQDRQRNGVAGGRRLVLRRPRVFLGWMILTVIRLICTAS